MDGKVLGADEVRRLATLESREVLLARLAGLLQASAQQTVNLLAAPLRQVATMTAALRDQKAEAEPQGGGAAAQHGDQKAEAEPPAAESEAAEAPAGEGGNDETNDAPAETAGTES
jgi:large subunit ribosomal protein L10